MGRKIKHWIKTKIRTPGLDLLNKSNPELILMTI